MGTNLLAPVRNLKNLSPPHSPEVQVLLYSSPFPQSLQDPQLMEFSSVSCEGLARETNKDTGALDCGSTSLASLKAIRAGVVGLVCETTERLGILAMTSSCYRFETAIFSPL